MWTSVEILLDTSLATGSDSLVNALVTASTSVAATTIAAVTDELTISTPTPVSPAQLAVFFLLLVCATAAVELFVRRPMTQLMPPLLDLAGKRGLADKEAAVWEKLVGCASPRTELIRPSRSPD